MNWDRFGALEYVQRLTTHQMSAGAIAARVRVKFNAHCTRNMIIGLWHRRRVSRVAGSQPTKRLPSHRPEPKPKPVTVEDLTAFPDVEYAEPLRGRGLVFCVENQPGQCKWPVAGDQFCLYVCGQPVAGSGSYCGPHRSVAYRAWTV